MTSTPVVSSRSAAVGRGARIALGVIRVVNGAIGLVAPSVIVARLGDDPAVGSAAIYGLRLFGVRTVVLGLDLLRSPAGGARIAVEAVVIHASDTATVAGLARSGRLDRGHAGPLLAISGLNSVLAVLTWWLDRPGRS